ncbi:ArnT family glycosyltransferase [Sulfurimonas sp.]|uniref:ArnT family glycosyltransferase n=1 Tax=Sulfurimonas sp. TaxID=2022749 RepID=UPI002AB13387|nr:glycosyltransferase family 39 protein [Sulfurimonas sp.]
MNSIKAHSPFFAFIALVAIIRLLLAPHLGLGADEAHYVIYALNLDWSYYDHPPLVGWVQYIFTSIFGLNEFGARVSAISIGFFTSIFIYFLIFQIDKDSKRSFIAILALHASFLFNALFLMTMPDTLLFLLIIPIIYSVIAIEEKGSNRSWLMLGLFLGLAGLAKYTAILFLIPIILYFIIRRRFDILFSPNIIPSAFLALLIVSPVIYWNIQTDFASLIYQSNHVVGASSINWNGFTTSLVGQFIAYNPFLFPLAFFGLYKSLRSKNSYLFLSALFGLVLFSFFTYSALYKTALPHWSALFYMLFIPIGVYYFYELSKGYKKYLKIGIGFGLIVSALIYIEVATKIIPLPDENSLQIDIYGFENILKEANGAIKDGESLAVTHWTLASRAIFYNDKYRSKMFLIDSRDDQFDIWEKSSPIGKDLIVIDINFLHKNVNNYMKCDKVEKLKSFNVTLDKSKPNTIELVKCTNFQGLK